MFEHRSYMPEMMDDPEVDSKLLQKNLRELDLINFLPGGYAATLNGVKMLIDKHKLYTVVDLGCGSGGTLKYLAIWARKKKLRMRFLGVDANSKAIQYLQANCIDYTEISGVVQDYDQFLKTSLSADIYICSLFCHHLDNDRLVKLFRDLKRAKAGFVINDLHRSAFAYYSIKVFTWIFRGTVLSKNDGPLSVLKAFKKAELEHLLWKAGCNTIEMKRQWFFRYLAVVRNHTSIKENRNYQ